MDASGVEALQRWYAKDSAAREVQAMIWEMLEDDLGSAVPMSTAGIFDEFVPLGWPGH